MRLASAAEAVNIGDITIYLLQAWPYCVHLSGVLDPC